MEILELDGKRYVKASKAARDLGYATDYVGQLCRSGQVGAHLIGRTWYVNQEELGTHRVEKKRISRVKAREQAKKTIEAHRVSIKHETEKISKHMDIRYERDDSELIPATRKLTVVNGGVAGNVEHDSPVYETEQSIEHAGEKTVMSGNIPVVDVTDETANLDVVVLTPSRIGKSATVAVRKTSEEISKRVIVESESNVSSDVPVEMKGVQTNFREKLAILVREGDITGIDSQKKESGEVREATLPVNVQKDVSMIGLITILFVVFCVISLMIPLSLRMSYVQNLRDSEVVFSLGFSIGDTVQKIRSKI